jgi:hypothetical protein
MIQVDLQTFQDLEVWDRDSFWSSYSTFFKERGYTLFNYQTASRGAIYVPVDEPIVSESPIYAVFSRHMHYDLRTYVPRVCLSH